MTFNEFNKKFKVLQSILKFAPRDEDASQIWFAMTSKELTDEQINAGFMKAFRLKEFPSYAEFVELAMNLPSENDEIQETVGQIMAAYNDAKAVPDSSAKLAFACKDDAIFEALGGHDKWWRIQSGYEKIPRQSDVENIVKALVAKRRMKYIEENLASKRLPPGVKNVALL